MIFKSSLLLLGMLSVLYTLNTLSLTQKYTQKIFPKHINPLYIGLVSGLKNLKKILDQIKSDSIWKYSMLTLDFNVKFTLHTLYNVEIENVQVHVILWCTVLEYDYHAIAKISELCLSFLTWIVKKQISMSVLIHDNF